VIYMLRGLYDLAATAFTGAWWFDMQDQIEADSPPAVPPSDPTASQINVDWGEDDGTPLPPAAGDDLPACIGCNDPNFSLESDYCITCRAIR
jgi:hypothetical protein